MHTSFQLALDEFFIGLEIFPPITCRPTNFVYTVHLKQAQDISRLSSVFLYARRNVRQFPSANWKLANPSATIMLFQTGNMLCVGAHTEAIGLYCLMWAYRKLLVSSVGYFFKPVVSNIVVTAVIGEFIDLASFVAHNETDCSYNPKKFAGCTYTPQQNAEMSEEQLALFEDLPSEYRPSRKTCVIFEEVGKFNAMGAQNYNDVFALMQKTVGDLRPFFAKPKIRAPRKKRDVRYAELVQKRKEYAQKKDKPSAKRQVGADVMPALIL